MRFANPSKKLRTVASVRGHVIDFPGKTAPTPDNPTGLVFVLVPPAIYEEVQAAGLVSETEMEEEVDEAVVKAPDNPEERKQAIYAAFEALVNRNAREEFAGNGAPKAAAVDKQLGWTLDPKELKVVWPKFQAEVAKNSK
jgi:hypothetical protein